jgi:uncharacterized protein (TIGR02145 family)
MTALNEGIEYYVRAYATNNAGIGYGMTLSFKTLTSGVIDYDGNAYKTIQIGTQIWMAENLKTVSLNDGTSIPNVPDAVEWGNLGTPGYCWYLNDEATYKNTYGALYNFKTVNTGKLCPSGWHVPLDSEWNTLILTLDPNAQLYSDFMSGIAADKLNECGFSTQPGGCRINWCNGKFGDIGYKGYWWSSDTTYLAYLLIIQSSGVYKRMSRGSITEADGLSVRCVKDN